MAVAFQPDFFQNNFFQTGAYPPAVAYDPVFYTLTIGGVPQPIRSGTFRISETINGTNTMSFEVVSWSGDYRPAINAEVIYARSLARLFGGLLDTPSEFGLHPYNTAPLVNTINAVDFNTYVERRVVNGIIPAGTLMSVLLLLMPFLTPYGVTLDPAQVTGPAVPIMTLPFKTIREWLDELSDLTGYVWEIDYNKILRMFLPGSLAAAFDVVPASDASIAIEDITVERVRSEYANRILVVAGSGLKETTEDFIGDESTRVFVLSVAMTGYPTASVNGVGVVVGIHGVDTHLEWTFRASDNAMVQLAEAPAGTPHSPLAVTDTLVVVYPGQYPFMKVADDFTEQSTHGIWEKVIMAPDVFDVDAAQALADSYLPRYITAFKNVSYNTRREIHPGRTQTITVPERDLSGTFLITDVVTTDTPGQGFLREVKAVGGTTLPISWKEFWKRGGWGGGSPSAIVSTGNTATTVLSSPAFLGGSRNTGSAPNPAAWTPVVDYVLYTATASFGARVRAQAWARNVGISAAVRLYDVTAAAVVAASGAVTSTTPIDVTFLVGLTLAHVYRLELISGTNGQTVFAIGTLESA